MWCASFGFSEEEIIEAAVAQLRRMPFYHTLFDKTTPQAAVLAEKLIALAPVPMSHVFFCNSGSEANDSVIKFIRFYNNSRGLHAKKKFIARRNGFHGVSLAAASLTGIPAIHADFDLPLPGFLHTGFPHYWGESRPGEDEDAFVARLATELDELIVAEGGAECVAAFIAEPVMGAAGAVLPPRGYFQAVQAVLRKHDILFIADEVICGFGRTGHMFGSGAFGIEPDIMTVAKALSGAYQPIAAVLLSAPLVAGLHSQSIKLGSLGHAFTTSAHPVAVAAAVRAVDLLGERDILGHVREVSVPFLARIHALAAHPLVGTTRGIGLIGAAELSADKATRRRFPFSVKDRVRALCQERGLIIRATGATDSLCFAPPLIISESEVHEMFDIVVSALDDVARSIAAGELPSV
jgi:4-aminobutyrate---pyruvate transaminase